MLVRTCYGLSATATFTPSDEDDITLACVDIIVFENEELVDTVLLQHSNFDDDTDRADEVSIEDDILLTANLSE